MIITIDGPVGSGKSSVAKSLSKRLNMYYLNTGLLYRAIAYIFFNMMQETDMTCINDIHYMYEDGRPRILFRGKDITSHLYDHTIGQQASLLSAKTEIREAILELQRNIAKKHALVAEGRDCGSVVFPHADYKFFLTARVDARAKRIFQDKSRGNMASSFEKVKVELEKRDERDKTRDIAPLIIPDGAIVVDNSDLNLEQTIEKMIEYIKLPRFTSE
jgi:cytidylate kinase